MAHILWHVDTHTHTHTRLTALFPGLPGWAGTREAKPIWILLKQETVSGSGINWAICKSAPRSRQITTPAPHHSVFYRPDALPAAQPTASKHWRPDTMACWVNHKNHIYQQKQLTDRQGSTFLHYTTTASTIVRGHTNINQLIILVVVYFYSVNCFTALCIAIMLCMYAH